VRASAFALGPIFPGIVQLFGTMLAQAPELVRCAPSLRQNGSGNKNLRPREPAGAFSQQTFIDLAEDRDCARGVIIVIRSGKSGMQIPGMQIPCGLGSELHGGFQ
jgi:hypothetical protein